MGLYERIVAESSREEKVPEYTGATAGRGWRHPAPEVGGYITVEDLEWEQERLQRKQMKALQGEKRRSAEIRALRTLARQGVHSSVQRMAFKSLQRRYAGEWDRTRWERRTWR